MLKKATLKDDKRGVDEQPRRGQRCVIENERDKEADVQRVSAKIKRSQWFASNCLTIHSLTNK